MSDLPRVVVCAGGGGVGKTTTAAALSLALARAGSRTLVVTVDPARRLAQAMGIEIDAHVHMAHVEPGVQGRLFVLMPEPRVSWRTFVEVLFEDEPDALQRVLHNRIYATMGDALAGVHEMVSLMLVARAVREAEYDHLVVDTAPSRYALDFVSYPGRLASLFEGRAVGWFGGLADRARTQELEGTPPPEDEGGLLAWGKKRVEAALGRILDPQSIRDVTNLFADLARVRHRFAELARASEALLLGERTRYVLVAAPSGSAEADVVYIDEKLRKLEQHSGALVLNRSDEGEPAWLSTLARANGLTLPVQSAVERLQAEAQGRSDAGDRTEKALRRALRGVPIVRLPTVEARDPSAVVRALADQLAPELSRLV